ncbi:S-adenosyl-L-methionine-dependent methyltransferase [Gonapodya prolifera JEL478]|uniref:S-adenosyl-L-methionine-dependent methyltransferase n=1 Tax=Gonapodya prolifera (strain JEL478) TaxID=1344416 RepID=A0A139AKW1_GONPJ|nr:S-adenosyl-L-methionine-dependent methyltransferase [Gonapodya prolifera JEL478]|eukprot:KXS17133.1 S-adenosyl-L-methionine-dependent methyltransferase [Gonapodya prolifera JEL478]
MGSEEETYGMAHRQLNYQSPDSLWLNMGLWSDPDDTFQDACKRLAMTLAKIARVSQGCSWFDTGYGCGDQTNLFLQQFRPARYVGVTYEKSHYIAAQKRVQRPSDCQVTLLKGDAVRPDSWSSDSELGGGAGDIRGSENKFDVVTCLDCAYHFRTREDFLHLLHRKLLREGGTLALADIIAGEKPWTQSLNWWNPVSTLGVVLMQALFLLIMTATNVPLTNLWPGPAHYEAHLRRAGFVDVGVTDISNQVFPGFLAFLERFRTQRLPHIMVRDGFSYPSRVVARWAFWGILAVLRFSVAKRWLVFVLAHGTKSRE